MFAQYASASCLEQGFNHYPMGVCSGRVEFEASGILETRYEWR